MSRERVPYNYRYMPFSPNNAKYAKTRHYDPGPNGSRTVTDVANSQGTKKTHSSRLVPTETPDKEIAQIPYPVKRKQYKPLNKHPDNSSKFSSQLTPDSRSSRKYHKINKSMQFKAKTDRHTHRDNTYSRNSKGSRHRNGPAGSDFSRKSSESQYMSVPSSQREYLFGHL